MRVATPEETTDFLRSRLHAKGGWPENVRPIGPDGTLFLGIDENNRLYWDGKPIEIQRRLKFSRLQVAGALAVGIATLIGGLGAGLNEGLDFGCKLHWWVQWCSR
jgi:hypothetical protein